MRETMWLDIILRGAVLSEVLKPTIHPEPFCSLFIVCSITCFDATLLNLPGVLLTEKLPDANS